MRRHFPDKEPMRRSAHQPIIPNYLNKPGIPTCTFDG